MLRKAIYATILSLFTILPAVAISAPPKESVNATAIVNKVSGLELPANQTVNDDEGFIKITATTTGTVKWLVLSDVKVKYIPIPASNSIIVSVPHVDPNETQISITVFAVAVVDNKLTDFAQTEITVTKSNVTPPAPEPKPTPAPQVTGKLHITVVLDLNKVTPALAKLLNSPTLRKNIADRGYFLRIYDSSSPVLQKKKLTAFITKTGLPGIIIQTDSGVVVASQALPTDEASFIGIINQITGGK